MDQYVAMVVGAGSFAFLGTLVVLVGAYLILLLVGVASGCYFIAHRVSDRAWGECEGCEKRRITRERERRQQIQDAEWVSSKAQPVYSDAQSRGRGRP